MYYPKLPRNIKVKDILSKKGVILIGYIVKVAMYIYSVKLHEYTSKKFAAKAVIGFGGVMWSWCIMSRILKFVFIAT